LTGSSYGAHIASVHDVTSEVTTGFTVQALDIAAFAEPADFERDIQALISEIRASPRARNVDRIYLPGEIEWRTKQERLRTGIPVPDSLLQELLHLGGELGVQLEWPGRLP
jgi:LDH2 family malate/lactate/ureidoglycolate dehydrogenase